MKHSKQWLIGSVYNEVHKVIPKVFDKNGPTFILVDGSDSKTNEANARLIAAAPELLEALKDLVKYLKSQSDSDLEFAEHVIAKAEGNE